MTEKLIGEIFSTRGQGNRRVTDGRTDRQTDGIAVASIQRLKCEHCGAL